MFIIAPDKKVKTMSKKDRRKIEKKRRKEREKSRQKPVPLAYHGNKYKTGKFVDLVFQTEAGIYESFVMEDRKLTDHDVRRALEDIIRGIRCGSVQFSAQTGDIDSDHEEHVPGLLTWSIREHWQYYLEKHPQPARDDVVGVLRTILGSIEVWGTINPESRGYLRYLEGFMNQLGVHCKKVPGDTEVMLADDDIEDHELLAAGRAWIHDSDADAAMVFRALACEMIDSGESEEVAETCQQLMGETEDDDLSDELGKLSIRAQQQARPAGGPIAWALSRLIGK
jgi:hypothetical protein